MSSALNRVRAPRPPAALSPQTRVHLCVQVSTLRLWVCGTTPVNRISNQFIEHTLKFRRVKLSGFKLQSPVNHLNWADWDWLFSSWHKDWLSFTLQVTILFVNLKIITSMNCLVYKSLENREKSLLQCPGAWSDFIQRLVFSKPKNIHIIKMWDQWKQRIVTFKNLEKSHFCFKKI